ncbi:MAG: hypothetical protein ABI835_20040 [Chloroflexota bacterium]
MRTSRTDRRGCDLGYRTAVPGSSQAGFPVYQRLGFAEYWSIGIYEWQPLTALASGVDEA